MMRIHVGIADTASAGWQLLLDQIGLSHEVIGNGGCAPEECSVIIVGEMADARAYDELRRYLKGGGAVLCDGASLDRLTGIPSRSEFIRYIREEIKTPRAGIGLTDIDTDCVIPSNANAFRTDRGKQCAFIGEAGGGVVVALPFNAGNLILHRHTERRSFYARRSRLPFERVAAVGKGGIRALVAYVLETLHHMRSLPFVQKWYYPEGRQSIFTFRIDTDHGTRQEIETLYQLLGEYNMPSTWFLDVQSQQHHLELYRGMSGHEMGIHCFEHRVFKDRKETERDMQAALERFQATGIAAARGYAAPYGVWNSQLAKAVQSFGFSYSSEFSYDYDNHPSCPVVDNRLSPVLQVPIHPVSLGSLRRQGFEEEEMKAYFFENVAYKLHRREPVILYHHPKDGNHTVLASIFKFVRENGLEPMLMADFAGWWKERTSVHLHVSMESSTVKIAAGGEISRLWLRISTEAGKEAVVPARRALDLREIAWKDIPALPAAPDDIERIRAFNPWIAINRIEDFLTGLLRPAS